MEIKIKSHWKQDAEKKGSCIHQLCKEELILFDVTVATEKVENKKKIKNPPNWLQLEQ